MALSVAIGALSDFITAVHGLGAFYGFMTTTAYGGPLLLNHRYRTIIAALELFDSLLLTYRPDSKSNPQLPWFVSHLLIIKGE